MLQDIFTSYKNVELLYINYYFIKSLICFIYNMQEHAYRYIYVYIRRVG